LDADIVLLFVFAVHAEISELLLSLTAELKSPPGVSRLERHSQLESIEFYLRIVCLFLAIQTFIFFYCWVWVHVPIFLPTQVSALTKLAERISMSLFASPELVTSAVQMTESIASHPKNLESMSKAMQLVMSSEVFMASMRRVLKQILLDRDVQRIVGVSMAGISKEAVKNTFSWNPNETEDARQELLRSNDVAEKEEIDSKEVATNTHNNPLQQLIRGFQLALDPHLRQHQQQEDVKEQDRIEEQTSISGDSIGGDTGGSDEPGAEIPQGVSPHRVDNHQRTPSDEMISSVCGSSCRNPFPTKRRSRQSTPERSKHVPFRDPFKEVRVSWCV
jgi:hypothetical protein